MLAVLRLRRQPAFHAINRVVAGAILLHLCPVHYGADALAHAARGLGFREPDSGQRRLHVGRIDHIDALFPEIGKDVFLERGKPLCRVFAVAPGGRMLGMHLARRFLERGNALARSLI